MNLLIGLAAGLFGGLVGLGGGVIMIPLMAGILKAALRIIFAAVLTWTGVTYLRTTKPQPGSAGSD